MVRKDSLTTPIVIGIDVLSHEAQWSCMCVLDRYSLAKGRPVEFDLTELIILSTFVFVTTLRQMMQMPLTESDDFSSYTDFILQI